MKLGDWKTELKARSRLAPRKALSLGALAGLGQRAEKAMNDEHWVVSVPFRELNDIKEYLEEPKRALGHADIIIRSEDLAFTQERVFRISGGNEFAKGQQSFPVWIERQQLKIAISTATCMHVGLLEGMEMNDASRDRMMELASHDLLKMRGWPRDSEIKMKSRSVNSFSIWGTINAKLNSNGLSIERDWNVIVKPDTQVVVTLPIFDGCTVSIPQAELDDCL